MTTAELGKTKMCVNCVHSHYEETAEETEVLVCFLRRKSKIVTPEFAEDCPDYYTSNMDAD